MLQAARQLFFLSLLIPFFLFANESDLLKHRMIADLEVVKNTYEVCYAPALWKKEYAGWDLESAFEKARLDILGFSDITTKDYQRVVRRFLLSMRDYHVAPIFHSTELAYLPFRIQSAENRYFVTGNNVRSSIYNQIPVLIGDEILAFNDEPIHDAVQRFKLEEFGNPESLTDQGMAEGFFTSRLGALGHVVPNGRATVKVRHRATGEIVTYTPEWEYRPEQIQSAFNRKPKKGSIELEEDQPLSDHPFFAKKMTTPLAAALKGMYDLLEDHEHDLMGNALDVFGTENRIVSQTGSAFFQAYIYENAKKQRIGYIRIPTYHAGYNEAQELAQIITQFQNSTQALIIDQLNNPGGYFFFMYAVASMLTDKPLRVPLHRQTLTQEDVAFAIQYLNTLENIRNTYDAQRSIGYSLQGYAVDYRVAMQIKKHFRTIIDEWNTGNLLTSALPLYGFETIQPHPTARYTKPILMLINHMDFSCGDFMPAILQDNKRAVLFGSRTAGAGGFVLKGSHPNRFGIASYSYTGSIAERLDHHPIENLGVTPDIPYRMSAKDLGDNYCEYHNAIQEALDRLLGQ